MLKNIAAVAAGILLAAAPHVEVVPDSGGSVGVSTPVSPLSAVCAHSAYHEVDGVAGQVHVFTRVRCTVDGAVLAIETGPPWNAVAHRSPNAGQTYTGPTVSFPNVPGEKCVLIASVFTQNWAVPLPVENQTMHCF